MTRRLSGWARVVRVFVYFLDGEAFDEKEELRKISSEILSSARNAAASLIKAIDEIFKERILRDQEQP